MKVDEKQEMERGLQIAGTLADHLMASGAYRIEMGFLRDGHEFLVTVEQRKREQVSTPRQDAETGSKGSVCH